MDEKLRVLAKYYSIDDVLKDNDINPLLVFSFLFDNDLIDVSRYFLDEEEEWDG